MFKISKELKTETFGESNLLSNNSIVSNLIKDALIDGSFRESNFASKSDNAKLFKCELIQESKINQPIEVVALFDNKKVIGTFLNY